MGIYWFIESWTRYIFALGWYCAAMYLQITSSSEFPNSIPEFFGLYGVDNLHFFWEPFRSPIFSLFAIWVIPALVAGLLGFLVFRNRIKGVYFSILTQAALLAVSYTHLTLPTILLV